MISCDDLFCFDVRREPDLLRLNRQARHGGDFFGGERAIEDDGILVGTMQWDAVAIRVVGTAAIVTGMWLSAGREGG